MNRWSEHDQAAFAEVDAALRSAPITPPPHTLAPAVLARLRALAPAPLPPFRLTWLDVAIPAFIAGMAGLMYLMWLSLPRYATQQFFVSVQVQWLIFSQRVPLALLGPGLLLGVGLALAAGLTAVLIFREPRYTLSR